MEITWNDFSKVEMRVGKILEVQDFPEARKPAYKLTIDFGAFGTRRSSAQITNYSKEQLLGRRVVAVVNFPPRQVGPFISQVLVLGSIQPDGTVLLLQPEETAELGTHIA